MFILQEATHGQGHSIESVHDEHKPLLYVNSSDPSLSTNDVIASGSGKKAQRQKHVHFSGTDSEERTVRRPSSQSIELPTKDYEVSWHITCMQYYVVQALAIIYYHGWLINRNGYTCIAINLCQIVRVWITTSATMCLTSK